MVCEIVSLEKGGIRYRAILTFRDGTHFTLLQPYCPPIVDRIPFPLTNFMYKRKILHFV